MWTLLLKLRELLEVLDGAVAVFESVLQVFSLNQKRFGDRQINMEFQELAFINKMDRVGADFDH